MAKTLRRSTGSRLLGEELRRMRGARRLEDIVELSKAEVLAGAVKPLSMTSLCEVERGVCLPRLDTLFTLCMVYRVSPARFVAKLLEDRMAAGHEVPESDEQLEAKAVAALRESRWPEALALVLAGQARAEDDAARLRWQLRHALVLSNIGLLDQAIREFRDVLDSPGLPPELRGRIHLDIACAVSRAGHVTDALFHSTAALSLLTDEAPAAHRMRALQTAIAVAIRRHALGAGGEAELREALRRTAQAAELLAPGDDEARLTLDIYVAQIHDGLGNRTLAHEMYRKLETECAAVPSLLTCVLVSHAELLSAWGRKGVAREKLEKAASMASECRNVEHGFEAHYLLMGLAKDEYERALHHRACRRYMAQATSTTPHMRQFEAQTARGGAR